MPRSSSAFKATLLFALALTATAAQRKVVLIAGVKSHGPKVHEYLKSVKLLKVLLDINTEFKSEVHFNGWPEDPRTLDTASTIVIISDGQPSDRLPPMPLMTPERMQILERQMKRGCGLISIHYSTFITYNFADEALRWQGGYYEWKARNGQTSLIKTIEATAALPNPKHAILNGIEPFKLKDEFYYRLRLHDAHIPILQIPDLPGTAAEQTVAWAIDRPDGGRGFATSTGHFFSNWQNDSYRKLILNAIVWTAGADVPPKGVNTQYVDEAEVNRILAKPVFNALIVAPPEEAAALREALESEIPRFRITTIEDLPETNLARYKLILKHGQTLTPQLEAYAKDGGGLALVGAPTSEQKDETIEPKPHEITRQIPAFETKADASGTPQQGELIATNTTIQTTGKGRIFRTSLGRDAAHILNPGVIQLVNYGALWAARIYPGQPR